MGQGRCQSRQGPGVPLGLVGKGLEWRGPRASRHSGRAGPWARGPGTRLATRGELAGHMVLGCWWSRAPAWAAGSSAKGGTWGQHASPCRQEVAMTHGEEDSAPPGACISRDAGRACLRAADGETEAQGRAMSGHKALTMQLGREASRIFGSSRQSPRSLAAKVLEAQVSPRRALRWGSRHSGALIRGRGWGRALSTAPPPKGGSVIKIPGLGFWCPVLAVLDCMLMALQMGPNGPQDVKRQHRDECSP